MTEKVMQTIFGNYIKVHPPLQSEAYELKIAKGSLPFSSVKPHQSVALLQAEQSSLYHKITDQPWIADRPYMFTSKKPFDCFVLVKVKAFVVVWFYIPRKPRVFIKIPIKTFIEELNTSSRKSLTLQRASEIGEAIYIKHGE